VRVGRMICGFGWGGISMLIFEVSEWKCEEDD
jgi:hypothetical protein